MQLRIDGDFDAVANNVQNFKSNFQAGIAQTLFVSEDRVDVVRIHKGSILVDFRIVDPPAASSGSRSATEAADRLDALLASRAVEVWPSDLQVYMSSARMTAKARRQISADSVRNSHANVITEVGPPVGCKCRAVPFAGIQAGCAEHLSLSPAWCPVEGLCTASRPGRQGLWVFCTQTRSSIRAMPSASPKVRVTARGSALNPGLVMVVPLFFGPM